MTAPFLGRVSLREMQTQINSLQSSPFASPEMFGAIGDGASHPASTKYSTLAKLQAVYTFATDLSQELDWLGWQAALNAGGAVGSSGKNYVMCNAERGSMQPLTFVAGQSWAEGHGSHLDFTAYVAAPEQAPLNADPSFQLRSPASPWVNSTLYEADEITGFKFDGTGATYTDPGTFLTSTTGHFFSMGQQVTLSPGRYRVICSYEATLGASYSDGNFNPPYASIGMQTEVGNGQNPIGVSAALTALNVLQGVQTGSSEFDFAVAEQFTAYVTIQGGGYLNLQLTDFRIIPWEPDCALLMTRDGAVEHYPIRQPFSGFIISGPGGADCTVDGVRWKSFNDIDGNVPVLRDCVVRYFRVGLSLEDGSYLTEQYGVEVYGCLTCVRHPPGGQNSGENYRFYGGGLNNSLVAIENASGAEITFYSTSIDYNVQVLVGNTGRVEFHSCHIEMNMPQTAGVAVFECLGNGCVNMFGGELLGAGSSGLTCAEPPFRLVDAASKFRVYGTELYGYNSVQGVMCSGEGMLSAPGGWINGGNPNLGFVSLAARMDVLAGAGSFDAPGSPLIGGDPSGVNLQGGLYPLQAANIVDKWNSTTLTVATSTDYAFSGTKSLKIRKLTAGDPAVTDDQLVILIPYRQGQDVFFQGRYLAPEDVGSGIVPIYYRAFEVQVIGSDIHGRPIFGPGFEFRGETDLYIDMAGSTEWKPFGINTVYGSLQGAAWTTHLALVFDTQNMPAMSIYFDDMIANVL